MKRDPVKTTVAAVAALYFLWCAWDPYEWHLIDGVNLIIHEAGHVIFMPSGEFMMIAGGSIFQVIVPLVFVVYFFKRGQFYSAGLVMFWVGESMLNVSVYAGDAVARQLPLLGGENSIHDWNYLLDRTGLLGWTGVISGVMRFGATAVILAATVIGLIFAKTAEVEETEEFSRY